MTRQPHPLRCETCDYRNDVNGGRCPGWQFSKFIINIVGCASHSDAVSAAGKAEGAKEERGRVLDAVVKISDDVSFARTSDRNVFNQGIESLRGEVRKSRSAVATALVVSPQCGLAHRLEFSHG